MIVCDLTDLEIAELLRDLTGLNDWETQFVEAVSKLIIHSGWRMTEAMRSKAEQIIRKSADAKD